jgi:hypothetical protein
VLAVTHILANNNSFVSVNFPQALVISITSILVFLSNPFNFIVSCHFILILPCFCPFHFLFLSSLLSKCDHIGQVTYSQLLKTSLRKKTNLILVATFHKHKPLHRLHRCIEEGEGGTSCTPSKDFKKFGHKKQ